MKKIFQLLVLSIVLSVAGMFSSALAADYTISLSSATTTKEASGFYDFIVSISPNITNGDIVTVDYNQIEGSGAGFASVPGDFDINSNTLTFHSGATSPVTIPVVIHDDSVSEGDETFQFVLSNPTHDSGGIVALSPSSVVATISNDDYVITSDLADVTIVEDVGSKTYSILIDRIPAPGDVVTLGYYTSDGAAIKVEDYTETTGSIVFDENSSSTSQQIVVPIVDGNAVEVTEEFSVALSASLTNFTISGNSTAEITITDNDYVITSTIVDVSMLEDEADPIYSFTINPLPVTGHTVTVAYNTTNGTAVSGSDYTATTGSLSFDDNAANQTQTITIPILTHDDAIVESTKSFTFEISAPGTNYTVSGADSSTIEIEDDDYEIRIIDDFAVEEGDGTVTVNVLVTLVPALLAADEVTIQYKTSDGGATSGNDYTAIPLTTYSFSTANPLVIPVQILNDGDANLSEIFTVDLSNISTSNATFEDDQCEITINDHQFVVDGFSGITVVEGEESVFTISLDRNPINAEEISIMYITADGDLPNQAVQSEDYTPVLTKTEILIDATDTAADKQIKISTIDDSKVEILENYKIILSDPDPNTRIDVSTATGNITDNDYYIKTFSDLSVDESSGTFNLDFVLNRVVSGDDVVFSVSFVDVIPGAIKGTDYDSIVTLVTLIDGSGDTGQISIDITDDTLIEQVETFVVKITPTTSNVDLTHASSVDNEAEVSINIDEKYVFSINDITVVEGDVTDQLTVTLIDPTPLQGGHDGLEIYYQTVDGSATAPDDYQNATGTLTFTTGANAQNLDVTIKDDTIDEGASDNFFVQLTGASIPEIVHFGPDISTTDNEGEVEITDTDYVIKPTWTEGGEVGLESPIGNTTVITNGNNVGINNNEQAQFTVKAYYNIKSVTINGTSVYPTCALPYVTLDTSGGETSGGFKYTFESTTPQQAHTIDVVFDHQISMTADGNGKLTHTSATGTVVDDSGPTNIIADHNENELFLIESNDTSLTCLTELLIDNSDVGVFTTGTTYRHNTTYTFPTVTTDHSIEAKFVDATTITVELQSDDGSSGSSSDLFIQDAGQSGSGWRAYVSDGAGNPGTFIKSGTHGGTIELPLETPCDTRYILIEYLNVDGWLRPGDFEVDLQNNFQDQTVTGFYDANSHLLSLNLSNGTVIIDPEGEPGVTADSYIFIADTTITLTASPDAGWFFQGWQGTVATIADISNNEITVSMDRDRELTPVFVQGCEDLDSDGYTTAGTSCVQSTPLDCADQISFISNGIEYDGNDFYPGAPEICGDGLDQDCDGSDTTCVDDDADDDGDGYTENQGDCDDTDADIHPGAYDDPSNTINEDCYDGAKVTGSEELCVDISDIPANAAKKPGPPLLMFILDDSGSMDWEFMTDQNEGKYSYDCYVFDYDGASRAKDDRFVLPDSKHKEWQSQFFGYNRIFFNPDTEYVPWPMWAEVVGAANMRTGEKEYDTDNSVFPDILYADDYTHADMDKPRLNSADSSSLNQWYHPGDGQTNHEKYEIDLDDTYMTVNAEGGQQVSVIRHSGSSVDPLDTRSDAIGFSTSSTLVIPTANTIWSDYLASEMPEVIFDNQDGASIFETVGSWEPTSENVDYQWEGSSDWSEIVDSSATWKVNVDPADEDDYYLYVWLGNQRSSDENAKYLISYYDTSDVLTYEEILFDQTTDPNNDGIGGWVKLIDKTFPLVNKPTVNIEIPLAHYYTYIDSDGDGSINFTDDNGDGVFNSGEQVTEDVYLITIPKKVMSPAADSYYELKYYRYTDNNNNVKVDDGELKELVGSSIPSAIIPDRVDQYGDSITDSQQLAYMVRQDFADWVSFYRKRALTAKSAVARTVEDMTNVELGLMSLWERADEPLELIERTGSSEMATFLSKLYNLRSSNGTPLRSTMYKVGKYFQKGTSGDDSDLKTTEGLNDPSPTEGTCSGDTSVFYDYKPESDGDLCDDTGGACQRAYIIAMTDGYYNSDSTFSPSSVKQVDNSYKYEVMRDGANYTLADISMYFYDTDMDPGLEDEVSAKGFDDQAQQHVISYTVAFGVKGEFDPELFPDCLPSCDTPGENGCPEIADLKVQKWDSTKGYIDDNGDPVSPDAVTGTFENSCPEWHDQLYSNDNKTIDDLYHAAVNSRGKFLNAADPGELVTAMQAIKDLIDDQSGTAASVSINANKIEDNTLLFQTTYDSTDWNGDVLAKCLDLNGDLAACLSVQCESTCNTLYESCLSTCTTGDVTCETVCTTAKDTCIANDTDCDTLTCGEIKTNCLDAANGNASAEVTCGEDYDYCIENTNYEVEWSASKKLADRTPDNRAIITAGIESYPIIGDILIGRAFAWNDSTVAEERISDDMKTSLIAGSGVNDIGLNRLEYIRGEQEYERQNDTADLYNFRNRSSILGDFINSEPYHYDNSTLGIDWVISGANDGMLHIFDGLTGEELFAYIPSMVFKNLYKLTEESYDDSHRYFVDGYVTIQDLGSKVILIGGIGKGGRDRDTDGEMLSGFFALDITVAAASIGNIEANAKNIVLWEYSHETLINNDLVENLGHSFSRPQIIDSNDSTAEKLLVFGNGYDSDNNRAALYVIGLDASGNREFTKLIDTGSGDDSNCNGLSTPAIVFPQGDGKNDFVYAGDLLGNLWKFDLSASDKDDWDIYFKDSSNVSQPLFQARSDAGYRQPITMKPAIGNSCATGVPGYMVAFGTGRLLDVIEDANDQSVQSVYGIWDWSAAWSSDQEQSYLGYLEPNSGPDLTCQTECTSEYGSATTSGTCLYQCAGNEECEAECEITYDSCYSNCTSIREVSNGENVVGNDTSAAAIGLLRQTQVWIGGINYASDESISEQEYGETDLDAWDQISRVLSDNQIDWMLPSETSVASDKVKHVGWYFDLPTNGERIIRDATIVVRELVYTSSIPSDSPCESGGTSHIWAADVCTGGRLGSAFFDLNNDQTLNSNDYINIGTEANPIWVAASSISVEGLIAAPTLVEVENQLDKLYVPTEEIETVSSPGYGLPIQSWRELDWQ